MMVTIHCFGTGLVGSYVVRYLSERGHLIHAYDLEPSRVEGLKNVITHKVDHDFSVRDIPSSESILAINMLPGAIGSEWTKALSEQFITIIDLSFSEITPSTNLVETNLMGSRILWDVGIAPGLSNMLASHAVRKMGSLSSLKIYVGGNPTVPTGEWKYMAPFSPTDVLEEYTRPARILRSGIMDIVPAISDRHIIEVPGYGEMEGFLTDGLRSLIETLPSSDMYEYTVRWPGHIQRFIDEVEKGTLDHETIIQEWKYDEGTPEFTWLMVEAVSKNNDLMAWNVIDEGGKDGHSMARTTGLVTAICTEILIEDENVVPPGVHPPEALPDYAVSRIISEMKSHGVVIEGPEIDL